jgi:hypothetical protein
MPTTKANTSKLAFQAFSDEKFQHAVGNPHSVQLNPESFVHKATNAYNWPDIVGLPKPTARFHKVGRDDLSFTLTLDGSRYIEDQLLDVGGEIKALRDMLYKYQGAIHSPYYIQVIWGTFRFNGLLTNFNVTHTLFQTTGKPLRARIELSFTGFTDVAMREMSAGKLSPDLTHRHVVRAGDTLSHLSYQFYGDAKYYLQVAQFNNLLNFTRLRPGTVLYFPPIR